MAMDDGHRKVGVSSDPIKRVLSIQTGYPQTIYLEGMWSHRNPFAVEKKVHRLLHVSRVGGEWFLVDKKAAFDAVLEALRAVAGGMLEYGDQPYFDITERRPVGVPPKLHGVVLDAARDAWGDPNLTTKEAAAKIHAVTGQTVSVRSLFTHLGKKTLHPPKPPPDRKDLVLTGRTLDIARKHWANPAMTARQAHEATVAESGVKLSSRLMWGLGKKSDAEATLTKPPPAKAAPKKAKPKRRERKATETSRPLDKALKILLKGTAHADTEV